MSEDELVYYAHKIGYGSHVRDLIVASEKFAEAANALKKSDKHEKKVLLLWSQRMRDAAARLVLCGAMSKKLSGG